MELYFDIALARKYKSPSQKIRVLTENWVGSHIFCPACGCNIKCYEHNRPVADFYCPECSEEFELKSKKDSIGRKIVDGAYRTMIKRLQSNSNPNLFLLNYTLKKYKIVNLFVVPKHFFVPTIIEKRKPLSQNAKRAGWTGCNILLHSIPLSGRIFYIKNNNVANQKVVLKNWQKTLFLRETKQVESKGWILDIMSCIDRLDKRNFTLSEMYSFEKDLKYKYPANKHIKDKIRQQLQFLRDKGYLEFLGRGKYRKL